MPSPGIHIRLNSASAQAAIRRLKGRAPRAVSRALNRSIKSGRTRWVRDISQDIKIKQAVVRERVLIREATPATLRAELNASLRRIPLIDFGASGPEPSGGRGRGVSYKIGSSRKRLPHAFIARMRSGHRGVFARVRRARLPITELHGPSIGHVFMKHLPAGRERAREALTKNLQHELKFAISESAG